MSRPRELVRALAERRVGERPVPVGGVAGDRRLLRRALADTDVGHVLVVGPGLAARQALPGVAVDVVGIVPHRADVTVCSAATGPRSLPPDRWDTVIVVEPGPDLPGRLAAVATACRPSGRVLVLDRSGWTADGPQVRALAAIATVTGVRGRGRRRLWTAQMGS